MVAGCQNDFEVRAAAGRLKRADFVIERLPVAAQRIGLGDHHVDFLDAPAAARCFDFPELESPKGLSPAESLSIPPQPECRCLERLYRLADIGVIDADRANL